MKAKFLTLMNKDWSTSDASCAAPAQVEWSRGKIGQIAGIPWLKAYYCVAVHALQGGAYSGMTHLHKFCRGSLQWCSSAEGATVNALANALMCLRYESLGLVLKHTSSV
uniref:Uncharacterized protein n=1 Tax=Eutreptiella gymnastica TaxID=73025 RepID=A0A7S4G6G8_9EUGL|mmetsp:Transcript_109261/g.185543  ORF Transcript_109261/g.185543 Transcript_109261/m.185543 type:complete len:109 (-) Transcript_109261:24-350(-)